MRAVRSIHSFRSKRTASATPIAGLHGFGGQVGRFTRSQGPGWALVGDAAYFKDPLTAHGITDALLHAELLADAIGAGVDAALSRYEATRTALATPVFDATEAIAGFAWSFDELRGLHTRLARAMADEIDVALAAYREAAVGVAAAATAVAPIPQGPGRDQMRRAG